MDIQRPSNARAKKIRRILYATVAVLLIAGVTFGLSRLKPAAPSVDRATVWTDEVKRGPMLREVRGLGTLVPEEIRWIPAQTESRVDRIVVRPGAIVKPDTIILELSNPSLQRDALDAEYQLKGAEADYENLKVQVNSELLNQKAQAAAVRSEYEQAHLQHDVDDKLHKEGLGADVTAKLSKVKDEQLGIRAQLDDILIGTHALFSDDVAFKDLGLAVVDEQHRFGVHQRMQLQSKGKPADVLVMTATPIPRTLALTAYGDMDVSRITGRPPGRKPVETRVMSADRLDELISHLRTALDRGQRAYWVCPLVEESEKIDLAAAEDRAVMLRQALGLNVGLMHGKMKAADRDAAMAAFKAGETQMLVATTVIEVGVDVPEATIMVVEHAERFGLAQLHQLRGRVGRGTGKSSCILVWHEPLGETAKARLKTMRDTDDGFVIAEEDLRLRGPGEMLGKRQSGLEEFRIADPAAHADLLAVAHDDARLVLARDPDLRSPRGEPLRVLLYLFGRDEAVRYLRAG